MYGYPGSAEIKKIPPKGLHGVDVMIWTGWTVTSYGCWEYDGHRFPEGYGSVKVKGTPKGTHRLAYAHWVGPIPEGLVVRHKCDNPPCINPDHLELGTKAQNTGDMISRGRAPNRKGENHWSAKLSDDDVRNIRSLYDSGVTQAELMRRYGMSQSAISSIVRRVTWKHIE